MTQRRPPIRQIIQVYPLGGNRFREDQLTAPTRDDVAWEFAESIAEKHVAGWLFTLAGRPVPGFEVAAAVRIEGLARHKPHPQGTFTWQVEGCALIIASGFTTPEALDVHLNDYRTAEGRIDRIGSPSSQRARLICAELEAGVHPREAINRHRLPSVRRDAVTTTADSRDAATLAYYRQLVVSGEVSE